MDESSTFDSSYSSSYTKPCHQEYNASYSSDAGPAYESYSSYARPLYESSNSPYEETVHESAFNKSSSYSQPSYKTSVRACAYEQPAYESSISTCYRPPPPSYHCSSYSDSEYGQPDWRSEPSYSIPSTPGSSESAYTSSSHKSSAKLPDFLGIFSWNSDVNLFVFLFLFCFILLGFSEFLLCGVFPYRDWKKLTFLSHTTIVQI